jgi:hypothetical protein
MGDSNFEESRKENSGISSSNFQRKLSFLFGAIKEHHSAEGIDDQTNIRISD